MSDLIASLTMYDWPERRDDVDAEWAAMRDRLRSAGIDAPDRLVRRNADMPPVPGGIRGPNGAIIAPDPATLPPEELDMSTLFRHPRLLFGHTCWGPMELGLADHVTVVGQPDYSDVEGGEGELYSSAIVMRREDAASAAAGGKDLAAPVDGRPVIPLDLLRGTRLAFNSHDSMSGIIALRRDLEGRGETLEMFAALVESGGHRNSVAAVAEGRADVAAIDCRSWALARRWAPAASALAVVGWTGRRKGLPYVMSSHLSGAEIVQAAIFARS